jgi:DNA processing protein
MSGPKRLAGPRHEFERGKKGFPACLEFSSPSVERLHVVGDPALLGKAALAVVGARKATPYGLGCAQHFARLAALRGLVIVSGGAIGCDQAAHRGALAAGGKTLVVLGGGADVIYPARAAELFAEVVASGGAVVSEAPWGSPPTRFGFRRRNRIIAGLAQMTLIVEAGLPSGTFSTADATLALGREVLVVPGSIRSKESRGSNQLILQGALPVVDDESFQSYLAVALGSSEDAMDCGSAQNQGCLEQEEQAAQGRLQRAMLASPMSVEETARLLGVDVIRAVRELSAMELAGTAVRLRDGSYTLPQSSGLSSCAKTLRKS